MTGRDGGLWPWLAAFCFAAVPVQATELAQDATPVLGIDALTLDVQVQVRVEEGRLLFQQDLTWTLPALRGVVQLDGVAVPLLFPAVGEPPVVVDRGIVPATTQSMEVEAPGALQVTRSTDSLRLQGAVTAGTPGTLRLRYALPVAAPALRLGLSGHAAGRTWLALALLAGPPVRLTLALDRPARQTRFEEGRERLAGATLAQPLANSQVVTVVIGDLPATARLPGRTLAWLAGALAVSGLAGLAAHRKAGRSEPAA